MSATRQTKKQYRSRPDSMKVAGNARFYSAEDRVWAMLHESVDRPVLKAITKNHAEATHHGDVRILGCAIHPECTHFFRTRDLKNGHFSVEHSGMHTSGTASKRQRNHADWRPMAGCEELSKEECKERLAGHERVRSGTANGFIETLYLCEEHENCDHRMQKRKVKGSSTCSLYEDGAHAIDASVPGPSPLIVIIDEQEEALDWICDFINY